MIVRDEEKFIARAIRSVRPIVNEIVVVDTGSKDRTRRIAMRLGAKVIDCKWQNSQGRARNVYLRHASKEWILALDADECIASGDLPYLRRLAQNRSVAGYILEIRNYTRTYDLLRQWHANKGEYPRQERYSKCPGWATTYRIRLFRNIEGTSYDEAESSHTYGISFGNNRIMKVSPGHVVIHHFQFLKGKEYFLNKQNRYFKSECRYLKNKIVNPWAYLNLGISSFAARRDKKAIFYLKEAIKADSKLDMAYFVLAIVYKELGMFKNALYNLDKVLSLSPENADAWAVLGMVFDMQDEPDKAEAALKKAISLNPEHILARNILGIVFERQGKLFYARRQYESALKLNPFFREAEHNLRMLTRGH